MRKVLSPVLFCAVLFGSTPANAIPITWEATGFVTSADGIVDDLFAVGAPITWTITFESDRPESTPGDGFFGGPGVYLYDESLDGLNWSATIAGFHYAAYPGGPLVTRVDRSGSMALDTSLSGNVVRGDVAGGRYANALDWWLHWNEPFHSLALPTTPPDSGEFLMYLDVRPPPLGIGGAQVRGTITSVHAVPEPSTLLLTGLGLAGTYSLRRYRARARRR